MIGDKRSVISGQFDNKIEVIGLDLCLVSCLVSDDGAALFTLVENYKASLCIGLGSAGAKDSAAFVRSVSGVYINVERAEAEGAMIARGVSEGEHLFFAVSADESVIVF